MTPPSLRTRVSPFTPEAQIKATAKGLKVTYYRR